MPKICQENQFFLNYKAFFSRNLSVCIILVLDATFMPNLTFLGLLWSEISFGENNHPPRHPAYFTIVNLSAYRIPEKKNIGILCITLTHLKLYFRIFSTQSSEETVKLMLWHRHVIIVFKYHELIATYDSFNKIYTDGSKISDCVALAVVFKECVKLIRLPDGVSIFRAELCRVWKFYYYGSYPSQQRLQIYYFLKILSRSSRLCLDSSSSWIWCRKS